MTIQAIMNQYQAEKVPDIIKDYKQLQKKLGVNNSYKTDKSDTPWWSGDIAQEIADKDYACAKALTTMAILNGPTDVGDLFSAYKEIKSGFKEKMPDGYDPKIAQHPFSFFRGTVLHDYLNPNSDKCVDKNWAEKVIRKDVSLRDTSFGKWILKKLGIKENCNIQLQTNIKDMTYTEKNPFYVEAKAFISKNLFGDLTVRALARTPKYSVYTLGGLGAIHSAYKIAEGENVFKEVGKTALQVGTTLAGMGYLGAIGYKHFGTCGSLLGMGLGTLIGTKVPELAFKHNSEIV